MSLSFSASAALAETGADLVPWIAGGAIALAVIGGGLLLFIRRKR
jgi:LPXTG-motif cell wall-anchored protein